MPLLFQRPAGVVKALAPIALTAIVVIGCGLDTPPSETTAPPSSIPANSSTSEMSSMSEMSEMSEMSSMSDTEPDLAESIAAVNMAATTDDQAGRDRCLAASAARERALGDRDDDDDADDEEDLSEEELEQTYAPEFPTVDGVAAPDERPALTPMTAFDPATATFEELDRLVTFCIENDVVSEAELFDEDGEDEGEDGWCEELAGLDDVDIQEFRAEAGADVVREEFEACGLPDPLDV